MIARFLFLILLLCQTSNANNFKESCGWLYRALDNAGRSDVQANDFVNDIHKGPQKFRLNEKEMPWTGYFFPFQKGGLTNRWQVEQNTGYKFLFEGEKGAVLSPEQAKTAVLKLSQEERNKLSPAEKMDIFLGLYHFPITQTEYYNRGPGRKGMIGIWEGFCNGRCAAGVITRDSEPSRAIIVKSKDGIELEFQPSDLKALLGASYFYVEKYAAMGSPLPNWAVWKSDHLANPGAFDAMIRSYFGTARIPFIFDAMPGKPIMNSTSLGYERTLGEVTKFSQWNKPLNVEVPEEATHFVNVELKVELTGEPNLGFFSSTQERAAAMNGPTKADIAAGKHSKEHNYSYQLFLDKDQKIIGGYWTSAMTPEIVWFPQGRGVDEFVGTNKNLPFDEVMKLVRLSAEANP